MSEVNNLIANMQSHLCENLQGIIAGCYYVEMLNVDDKVTLTIDDLGAAVLFDANLDLSLCGEVTPYADRKRVHESVHDTVVQAYRALADAIETSDVEMTNVM